MSFWSVLALGFFAFLGVASRGWENPRREYKNVDPFTLPLMLRHKQHKRGLPPVKEILDGIEEGATVTKKTIDAFNNIVSAKGVRHNVIEGVVNEGDKVLYKFEERRDYQLFERVRNTIRYPKKGQTTKEIITAVMIVDDWDDGTGGTAIITDGGVGTTHVTISLESQLMRGYHFTIIIYGKE